MSAGKQEIPEDQAGDSDSEKESKACNACGYPTCANPGGSLCKANSMGCVIPSCPSHNDNRFNIPELSIVREVCGSPNATTVPSWRELHDPDVTLPPITRSYPFVRSYDHEPSDPGSPPDSPKKKNKRKRGGSGKSGRHYRRNYAKIHREFSRAVNDMDTEREISAVQCALSEADLAAQVILNEALQATRQALELKLERTL
jgi:hypothetical protein